MSLQHGGGDDLEDDFVPDDLIAMSDDEDDNNSPIGEDALFSADEGEVAGQADAAKREAAAAKKRKRREKEKSRIRTERSGHDAESPACLVPAKKSKTRSTRIETEYGTTHDRDRRKSAERER